MNDRDPFTIRAGGGDPATQSAALFAGELAVFPALAGFARLTALARGIVERHFGEDPQCAEQRLAPEAFRAAVTAARREVRDDERIDRLWTATLAELGYPPEEVRRDRMRLRVVPAGVAARSRLIRPLPAHRDSWGSGIMAQVNWWASLYPLRPEATMHVWPDAFDVAVANTAASWDYETLMRDGAKDYPLLPEATQPPPGEAVAVLIAPGALLGFAAAHLHASMTEAEAPTRFGLDTRTVWMADVAAGRGAPNVDGGELEPHWDMFERGASGAFVATRTEQGAPR